MLEGCIAGAPVVDLCHLGDKLILEETGKVYKKEKEMKKGVRVCVCACVKLALLLYMHTYVHHVHSRDSIYLKVSS